MNLVIDATGRPKLVLGGEVWLKEIGMRVFRTGSWLSDASGEIAAGGWEEGTGRDKRGEFKRYRRGYFLDGESLLDFDIRVYPELIVLTAELSRDLTGISRGDSFTLSGVLLPHFSISSDLSFFLATFGLGGEGDGYPGGYWPTAKTGRGQDELPAEAFSPLVLYGEAGALAVSPGNFFLTSPLVKTADGVGRGVHGAIDRLSAGTRLETIFAFGEDVPKALLNLGDFLLFRSGKSRPEPDSHLLFSKLGWWNAYGGYYTEPIRKLDEAGLIRVLEGLRAVQVPLGYVGLDLWYPYEQIGQAIRYTPDPDKYPHGVGKIAQAAGVSTVLHLSALSRKNAYGTDGADPMFYREVAGELSRERAIVAWHDWLRTQQHLTPKLRADPVAAEHWFSGMADAFGEKGIDVLLCMQTMGMNLASTQHPNIIAGRTHTDYLFTQPEALEEAARHGYPEFQAGFISTRELHRQNLLMGMVLYAFGIMPFHDLFLSREHPGLGGAHPEEEAVLRALSCGPVGIGDGPGMSDPEIIRRLLLPDGTLAHPDHPPFPITSTLGSSVQAFFTEHRAGDVRWGYLLLINVTDEEASFRIDPPLAGDFLLWDGINQREVPTLAGTLSPDRIAYFILVPEMEGIGLLGLWERFIPAGVGYMEEAWWNDGWHLKVGQSDGRIAVVSDHPIIARTPDGGNAQIDKHGSRVWLIDPGKNVGRVHIHRR